MAASTKALIAEFASAPTPLSPPPSPLLPWSSPLSQIPSPPLPVLSPPLTLPSPPTHISIKAPLGYIAAMIPTPPFLLPSTAHRDDILEADMPLQKRARFSAPASGFEVGESSAAAAARQVGHALTSTMREVNERVTDLAATQRQDAHELHMRDEDAQDDQALLRSQARSKSRSQAMKAQIRALQRDVSVLQRERISDDDRLTSHIQHEHDRFRELVHTRDAGPQDRPTDAGSSC
ncbi:hypothetical protein Tco_0039251 [Tanacetum coccineum]